MSHSELNTAPTESPERPGSSWWRVVLESISGAHHDYTSGRLRRALLLLAVPMVLEMAMESVFAVCDIFFVSRLGDNAVATVGLTESMLTIVYALAIGIAMATTAMVARRIGEKNIDGAVRAATQAVAIGIVFGIVVGVPCIFLAEDLLSLMGASEAVIETGSGYTSILLGTSIVVTLLFLNNSIFRGAGDPALTLRALCLANAINIVLDPCLIFGWGPFPELGVTGAAVATSIGRGTGVLYQFRMLRSGRSRIALRGPSFRINPTIMLRLIRLSIGGVAQFLIATTSWIVLMRIVSPFGSSAVAGYTIAVRVIVFALLPSWGLANAAATLVGQNLGAQRPDRAEQAVWLAARSNAVFLGLVTVVFLALDESIVGLFSTTDETVRHGAAALRTISLGYVFYAVGMVVTQAFNGAGDTMTPTRVNIVCFWMLQIPLAWTLANTVGFGPEGVFWSVAIAQSALALVSVWIFRKGKWKETIIAADDGETG